MKIFPGIQLSEKNRILKNFFASNLTIFFSYVGLIAVTNIQYVLMDDRQLALIAQFLVYFSQLATSFVIPQVILELLGVKLGFALSNLLVLVFIVVQVVPYYSTLIPAALLAGLGKSGTWTIKGYYTTQLSRSYADLKEMEFSKCQTLFFGFTGAFFHLSIFFSAVLIAVVLQPEIEPTSSSLSSSNLSASFDYASSCGVNNCPETPLPRSISKSTVTSAYILFGCLIASTILSILIPIFFIDNPPSDQKAESPKGVKKFFLMIGSRFKSEMKNLFESHFNLNIWLLFILNVYVGFEVTLFMFELGQAFSTCLKNVNFIGWMLMLFGFLGSILAVLSSFVLKYTGKSMGITIAICLSLTEGIFIISWTPSHEGYYVIFLMVLGFAIAQPISMSQVRGLYGIYFPNSPGSIGSATVGLNLGYLIGTVMSMFICVRIKTYVYIGIVILSLISFISLEARKNFKTHNAS